MGWLERKWLSGGVRRCWERRWCAVHGGFLFFHAEQQAVPEAGAECDASAGSDGKAVLLPLVNATIERVAHHKRRHCFRVLHEERRGVMLDASSDAERERWLDAIMVASLGPANPPPNMERYFHALLLVPRTSSHRGSKFQVGSCKPAGSCG